MSHGETDLRLQLALDAADFSVWDSTLVDGDVSRGEVIWSARGAALLGLPEAPLRHAYQDFSQHVHPHDRDHVRDTIQKAANQGASYALEYRIVRPDAREHWLAARAHAFRDEHGTPTRTLGIIWDVTEKKLAEIELLSKKEMAEITLGSIGDGVLTTDSRGIVRSMNRIAEHLTGWCSEDAIGVDVDQVFRIVDELSEEPFENPVLKCLRLNQTIAVSNRSALVSRNGHRFAIRRYRSTDSQP